MVNTPLVPGAATFGHSSGPGQKIEETPIEQFGSGLAGGFFCGPRVVETVSDGTKKDRREDSVCAECGSANNLKLCSGCKVVRFCGRECHAAAWNKWHKKECKKMQQARG